MQDIEERDIPGKIRDRFSDIVKAKIDIAIMAGRNLRAVPNFAGVEIEPKDRFLGRDRTWQLS